VSHHFGTPPSPTKVVWNPDYDQWVERTAVLMCSEAHEADALPCSDHVHEARCEASRLLHTLVKRHLPHLPKEEP
jgi:hypothetical protein